MGLPARVSRPQLRRRLRLSRKLCRSSAKTNASRTRTTAIIDATIVETGVITKTETDMNHSIILPKTVSSNSKQMERLSRFTATLLSTKSTKQTQSAFELTKTTL